MSSQQEQLKPDEPRFFRAPEEIIGRINQRLAEPDDYELSEGGIKNLMMRRILKTKLTDRRVSDLSRINLTQEGLAYVPFSFLGVYSSRKAGTIQLELGVQRGNEFTQPPKDALYERMTFTTTRSLTMTSGAIIPAHTRIHMRAIEHNDGPSALDFRVDTVGPWPFRKSADLKEIIPNHYFLKDGIYQPE